MLGELPASSEPAVTAVASNSLWTVNSVRPTLAPSVAKVARAGPFAMTLTWRCGLSKVQRRKPKASWLRADSQGDRCLRRSLNVKTLRVHSGLQAEPVQKSRAAQAISDLTGGHREFDAATGVRLGVTHPREHSRADPHRHTRGR